MWIQFLLIVGIIALGAFFMRRTGADSHLAIRRIGFGLFIALAVLAVVFPQAITWVAQLIGVGRGTDLLLYVVSMMFLLFVYSQFRRNTQMQQKITGLTRAIALLEAERDARAGQTSENPPDPVSPNSDE